MTPKEKALELKEKFDGYTCYALIAVDELIEHSYQVMKPFWEEVKQEIEKL